MTMENIVHLVDLKTYIEEQKQNAKQQIKEQLRGQRLDFKNCIKEQKQIFNQKSKNKRKKNNSR